jgi:hypothetical protein
VLTNNEKAYRAPRTAVVARKLAESAARRRRLVERRLERESDRGRLRMAALYDLSKL